MDVVDVLAKSRIFQEANLDQLQKVAPLWGQRTLAAGVILWSQGDLSHEVAIVASGTLLAEMDTEHVGSVGPGELVGEAGTFFREERTATLRAATDVELVTLPASGLGLVRSAYPTLYELLLNEALVAMAQRIHTMNQQITQLATGTGQPAGRKERSALDKLLKVLTSSPQAPSVLPMLRKLPVLKKASTADVIEVARILRPRRVEAGDALFLEGEEGETVVIVVSGLVDVVRNVKGGKTAHLARVGDGVLLGTGSLILRERRNASCVAASEVWVYEMDRKGWLELSVGPRQRWNECLLAAMRSQLRGAGTQLSALVKGRNSEKKLQQAAKELFVFKSKRTDDDPWWD